jgi:hypothetical protein
MKKAIYAVLVACTVATLFIGCKKDNGGDNDGGGSAGSFTYAGKTSKFLGGETVFLSDNLPPLVTVFLECPNFAYVVLHFKKNTEGAPVGDFTYGDRFGGTAFTTTNFDGSYSMPGGENKMKSGTAKLSKSGNEYTIEFDTTLADGKQLKGTYKGILRPR